MKLIKKPEELQEDGKYWIRNKISKNISKAICLVRGDHKTISIDPYVTSLHWRDLEKLFEELDFIGPIPEEDKPDFEYYIRKANQPTPQNLCMEIALPSGLGSVTLKAPTEEQLSAFKFPGEPDAVS